MAIRARDLAEKDFLVAPGETSVLEAADEMRKRKLGFVIIGSADMPEGIVTEWDILEKVVAGRKDPKDVKVREIMSPKIISVESDLEISEVANLMSQKGVRRLMVTEGGHAVGVITAKSVLAKLDDYVSMISSQISRLQAPSF